MSFDEFIFRLRERVMGMINSENSFTKFFSRLAALGIFALIVSTIAPTLADELSSSPDLLQQPPISNPVDTATPIVVDTPTASATPVPTESPIISRPPIASTSPSALAEASDSPTALDLPPAPLEVQPKYTLRIPSSSAIDPRAKVYFLPHIFASTGNDQQYTMVCISGSGLAFDALQKQSAQNSSNGTDLVMGDRSGLLVISADNNRAINLVNSYAGLMVYSTTVGIANRTISWSFVAVSKPVADPAFCSAARSAAITVLRPIGLEESTVKGSGTLK